MKFFQLIISMILLSIFSVNLAVADSGADFSPQTGLIAISSSNFNNATLLRRVVVSCPKKGFLVARANAGFSLRPTTVGQRVWIRYSIRRDSTANTGIDPNHYRNVQEFVMDTFHSTPGSMFRVDECKKNEKVTYKFVAQRVQNAEANTSAWQPRLLVEFFDHRI